jgi:hypothetical protein
MTDTTETVSVPDLDSIQPVDVADLINERRTIPVASPQKGGKITWLRLAYKPNWYTWSTREHLRAGQRAAIGTNGAPRDEDAIDVNDIDTLCACALEWSVFWKGEDGKGESVMVPLTREAIQKANVPLRTVRLMLAAIFDDLNPKPPLATASPNGSPTQTRQ